MSTALTIRQQIAPRPGTLYSTDPRSLTFTQGSLFSFPLHSTAYESDAATIRIPAGIKLCLHTVSVDRKEMTEFVKSSSAHGVCLKFSSEENGEMLVVWTYDKDRSGDVWQTGLGIEVEGPRIVRLAAVVDRGFKTGSALDVNMFGSVRKGDL
mmetsp:Transcript_24348/g.44779  ORF Transcript_24348/g.44779 Transcript_24348/m.44779 type:complete len:153 (+) Transcript_24348:207-665(+)|eukprot:CAMPEP_0201878324 /NCGR_PEP_ID=MMETSP0902-20130614/9511_1 /ASSEMBLY_ACC=CAM_ASM_000551 /TAXON_ID=420261 /ORGANISM="Thalassiosira antarctica, Strain CCMP982" /LENGTH=152 /DNA_ID=CAMNT_0048405947 /DNA_START=226 /DNA_END=684 /DNA_ORIENTATION=+